MAGYDPAVDLAPANPIFEGHPELLAVWLFGSRARGDARLDSDLDLGILLGRPPVDIADLGFSLQDELTEALGVEVQITVLDSAPADLVKRVFEQGRIVFERDRSARIAFQVRMRNEYWDLEPMWRMVRKLPPGVRP